MVADRNFFVAKAYATYSNNSHTLIILSLQYWRKKGQTTTHPEVYPCAEMPQISEFRQSHNGASHKSEGITEIQTDVPTSPNSRACHGKWGRTERMLIETEERSQREIPSAAT